MNCEPAADPCFRGAYLPEGLSDECVYFNDGGSCALELIDPAEGACVKPPVYAYEAREYTRYLFAVETYLPTDTVLGFGIKYKWLPLGSSVCKRTGVALNGRFAASQARASIIVGHAKRVA